MSQVALDQRTRALERALCDLERVRVPLNALLESWGSAAPELLGRPERVAELARSLEHLAGAGTIELPGAESWDRSSRPPLPRFVSVPSARRPERDRSWQRHPWRRELAFVASLPALTELQFTMLLRLDAWLAGPRQGDAVPARLRSAEIFGEEKYLDALERSPALFGPGRITYDILGVRRVAPPIYLERVGSGGELLIVENVDPFWATVEILRTAPDAPIGAVAFGGGEGASASVASLAMQETPPQAIWYWGDLDPAGVEIAARVATCAKREGLPTVRPAHALWAAMCELDPQSVGAHTWPEALRRWLGDNLWECSAAVRAARGRVSQERLTVDMLALALRRSEAGREIP